MEVIQIACILDMLNSINLLSNCNRKTILAVREAWHLFRVMAALSSNLIILIPVARSIELFLRVIESSFWCL